MAQDFLIIPYPCIGTQEIMPSWAIRSWAIRWAMYRSSKARMVQDRMPRIFRLSPTRASALRKWYVPELRDEHVYFMYVASRKWRWKCFLQASNAPPYSAYPTALPSELSRLLSLVGTQEKIYTEWNSMLNILYPCIGTQEIKRPNPGTSDPEPSVLYVSYKYVHVRYATRTYVST